MLTDKFAILNNGKISESSDMIYQNPIKRNEYRFKFDHLFLHKIYHNKYILRQLKK